MNIGLVAQSRKLAETLKEGLELSGNEVMVYESLQEATSAILEARFQSHPLPCELLIIDPDQGKEAGLIARLRLFLRSEELSIILLKNTSPLDIPIPDIRTLDKPITPVQLLKAIEIEQEG